MSFGGRQDATASPQPTSSSLFDGLSVVDERTPVVSNRQARQVEMAEDPLLGRIPEQHEAAPPLPDISPPAPAPAPAESSSYGSFFGWFSSAPAPAPQPPAPVPAQRVPIQPVPARTTAPVGAAPAVAPRGPTIQAAPTPTPTPVKEDVEPKASIPPGATVGVVGPEGVPPPSPSVMEFLQSDSPAADLIKPGVEVPPTAIAMPAAQKPATTSMETPTEAVALAPAPTSSPLVEEPSTPADPPAAEPSAPPAAAVTPTSDASPAPTDSTLAEEQPALEKEPPAPVVPDPPVEPKAATRFQFYIPETTKVEEPPPAVETPAPDPPAPQAPTARDELQAELERAEEEDNNDEDYVQVEQEQIQQQEEDAPEQQSEIAPPAAPSSALDALRAELGRADDDAPATTSTEDPPSDGPSTEEPEQAAVSAMDALRAEIKETETEENAVVEDPPEVEEAPSSSAMDLLPAEIEKAETEENPVAEEPLTTADTPAMSAMEALRAQIGEAENGEDAVAEDVVAEDPPDTDEASEEQSAEAEEELKETAEVEDEEDVPTETEEEQGHLETEVEESPEQHGTEEHHGTENLEVVSDEAVEPDSVADVNETSEQPSDEKTEAVADVNETEEKEEFIEDTVSPPEPVDADVEHRVDSQPTETEGTSDGNDGEVALPTESVGVVEGEGGDEGVEKAIHVDVSATDEETKTPENEEPASPKRKELDEQEHKALDDAFRASETPLHATAQRKTMEGSSTVPKQKVKPVRRWGGLGKVHPDTPIPNSDVAFRLLRKFARKTRGNISTTYGGARPVSLLGYFFGSSKEDPTFVAYRMLMDHLYEEGETESMTDESEVDYLVQGVLGSNGDTMERARAALAAFVYMFSLWGHASSHLLDKNDSKEQKEFSELLSAAFNAGATLAAHGCLDGVVIIVGEAPDAEEIPAANLLVQSALSADLSLERNELTALKFLLTTGCRINPGTGDALLRGSHLLQTIRLFYHIFLTTESKPNYTTARAALQQVVASVFARMARADAEGRFNTTKDNFPSDHHRDAFLVLRSICKLSMRALPEQDNHVGFYTSGSNEAWNGIQYDDHGDARSRMGDDMGTHREHAQLIYTAALHPALDSKILALQLILYILNTTNFADGFIQRSGAQFHAAVRSYLCVSLLKNCTSSDTDVVNLSLRIFVPLVQNFRTILKSEIEAFVTNVFFVILDSKNSPAEHKGIVVRTFDEICSDPATLAEIFLNYDCDLSAVDLFHRIVNTLSRVSRSGLQEANTGGGALSFMSSGASRMEKIRFETRELRLDAMRALRQVLASLHASIIEPMSEDTSGGAKTTSQEAWVAALDDALNDPADVKATGGQNLVEMYDSKKKRRAETAEAILRFNQKPSSGISYAAKCGHIDGEDPADVARYLLKHKDDFDKTQIGEYLGREADYQGGFSIRVLHEYVRLMDFGALLFDDAIRYFLSGFRLPGEAQKIDRIMEKFAERFTEQNPELFPSADVAFILAFSIIMLNTDLHNPAIKEERRMTKDGFVRNNRGICPDGGDLPKELLHAIFDRIKENPISLKEDDEARERAGVTKNAGNVPSALSPASFFTSHYVEMDRARESNFQKEREHIVRTTESLLKRRRHGGDAANKAASKVRQGKHAPKPSKFVRTSDSGLRDEYVGPMFEVAWGPALAAFSTAMESANGTMGALLAIATDEELEVAAENAAETIEVCLTGFRFAICTAGLCGNDTARDAYMLGLSRFSQLGTGVLLEPRHIRCIQTLLSLGREDGELLGYSWQHVFRALSEINRFHQLFHLMARNDRAAAAAAERRKRRLEDRESRRLALAERRAAAEETDTVDDEDFTEVSDDVGSLAESDIFSEDDEIDYEEDMDAKAVDEANARLVYEGVSEDAIEAIYERSSSLSAPMIKQFVEQLCKVSSLEISVGTGGGDLNQVAYRQQHALLNSEQFHHHQPNIYNFQKLVEVAIWNMESRPRMIFADLWSIIAEHLSETALHKNTALAMFAVDSFRQLSIQFLSRDESEAFEFQRRFLKPLESVMAQSKESSTKDLLLSCVARIIDVFNSHEETPSKRKGGLKSGWVPILRILGIGCQDDDERIAEVSSNILKTQVENCRLENSSSVLLHEHFANCVEAIMLCVNSPYDEVSKTGLNLCALVADYLADEKNKPPLKRRITGSGTEGETATLGLELWWPLLLGISRVAGDPRLEVRLKALRTLGAIVHSHFIPENSGQVEDSIQILQLIFRGILSPMLEFTDVGGLPNAPSLPSGFERFLTQSTEENVEAGAGEGDAWIDNTFDVFMDLCESICKRAIECFKSQALVEEVFAILNVCLSSDSGALGVKGVLRLEKFALQDLADVPLDANAWMTVNHMLRRCLMVRGLPRRPMLTSTGETESPEDIAAREEYEVEVREFVAEEKMLADRRYVGAHVVMVVGSMLSSDQVGDSMGLEMELFLVESLGRGISQWEEASILMAEPKKKKSESVSPPDYLENALYGRKLMNSLILELVSSEAIALAPEPSEDEEGDAANQFSAAKRVVVNEIDRLVSSFVAIGAVVRQPRSNEADRVLHTGLKALALGLLKELCSMPEDHLVHLGWITPVLLASGTASKDEDFLFAVQTLVELTSPKEEEAEEDEEEEDGDNEENDAEYEGAGSAQDSVDIIEGSDAIPVGKLGEGEDVLETTAQSESLPESSNSQTIAISQAEEEAQTSGDELDMSLADDAEADSMKSDPPSSAPMSADV